MENSNITTNAICPVCKQAFNPHYVNSRGAKRIKKFCSKNCISTRARRASRGAARETQHFTRIQIIEKETARLENQRVLYESLRPTHYTQTELIEKCDLSTFNGFKKYYYEVYGKELEGIKVSALKENGEWIGGRTVIFHPPSILKDVENYKNNIPPDGWANRDYILKNLDICEMTYWDYTKRWGKIPSEKNFFHDKIFLKSDADIWIANVIAEKAKQEQERQLKFLAAKQHRKELQRQKSEQVAIRVARNKAQRAADIAAAHARKLYRKANPKPKVHKVIRRNDDWTDWQSYEAKLKKKISFGPTAKMMQDPFRMKGWNANIDLMSRGENGDIQSFECSVCKKFKEYYHFYFDTGYACGRRTICKECEKQKRDARPPKKSLRNSGRFATKLVVSVRRHLNFINNTYQELSSKEIWAALGYTKAELIAHFERLMEPWMTWENNTHVKNSNDKAWHMDHIKPKSSFDYKTIYDPQFRECWALSNLRPLEAKANMVKSNFEDLNGKMSYLYRRFVILQKTDVNNTWKKYFDFTIEEARQHLEKNFKEGMSFQNHGKLWHIDHIIPIAAMPFSTIDDDNFKKLWHYTNLDPKYIKDNIVKHSRHDNKKHFTTLE